MRIDGRRAIVLGTVMVLGVGQPISAQTHPAPVFAAEAEGPIARATALELAKLQGSAPSTEFNRDGHALKGEARYAEAAAAAARHSKRGVVGAVIGAAAGVVVGVGLAIGYATRDCGNSCSDERAMIGVSLIGIPVGAGFAGYYIAK